MLLMLLNQRVDLILYQLPHPHQSNFYYLVESAIIIGTCSFSLGFIE